jgi:hypothetical protein
MRGLFIVLVLASVARAQTAKETPLLEDDLSKNKRTRIDAPKDSFDSALDDALGGPAGFSTKQLEKIEDVCAKSCAATARARPRG